MLCGWLAVNHLQAFMVPALPGSLIGHPRHARARSLRVRGHTPPKMCICVDCKLVDKCTAYRYVEEYHKQPHVGKDPAFVPNNPSINVIVHSDGNVTEGTYENYVELDVVACDSFVSEPGKWIKMMPKDTLLKAGFSENFVPT